MLLRHLLLATVFSIAIAAAAMTTNAIAADLPSDFRVVGYFPDYRFGGFDPASCEGLTDLMIFSAELDEDGTLNASRLSQCPWSKLQELKNRCQVRLVLVIGGWERSKHFGTVATSDERRKKCVESIVQYVNQYELDGVDLDWEHPKDDREQAAYGRLLADLRTAFTPHDFVLSVTIAPWQQLPAMALQSTETVQVMAYDNEGPHSTMEQATQAIEKLAAAKIPREKMVLGLPFYGRDLQSREAMTYGEIVAKFNPEETSDQVGQIYFNGEETIRQKVRFAVDSKLAGVMIWEIGQDAPGNRSLLKLIRETVPGGNVSN